MNLLQRLDKPWYLFQPRRAVGRLARAAPAPRVVRLPWGLTIEVPPDDAVGDAIARAGVYDLTVTEALWRLCDAGELTLDVGGNLGYMTSVLGRAVGPTGEVIVIEPNPQVLPLLQRNIERWRSNAASAPIQLVPVALSATAGTAHLQAPADHNLGTASLGLDGVEVQTQTLDDLVAGRTVGVMKLDVEGHELDVLRGGETTVRSGRLRDLIFEDHAEAGSPVRELLSSWGLHVVRLDRTFIGPRLGDRDRRSYDAPSYLATTEPDRARRRLAARGWRVLRPH